MQELDNLIINNEHVIVTAPDRFFTEAIVVLLIDWPPDLVDQALKSLQGSKKRIAIHLFNYNDSDYNWVLDVANQADVISINLNTINHMDIIKGYLLPKKNVFYFGRLGFNKLFSNFTDDPIGDLLIRVGTKISQMEVK